QYRSPVQLTVVTAKKGIEKRSEDGLSRSLVLHDGVRYSGKVGQQAYQQVSFAEHGIPLALPPVAAKKGDVESWSLAELFADRSIASRAELQWRLASPLMVLVLALAAVTLSRARPRQGRYSRLLWGLLVYIIYANLLTVARTAVEAERLPASIGLWGVHVVVFGLAIYWLFKRIGKNPRLIVNANTTPGAAA
ncbi:MAG: LptF/LptG family permease, partial [Gammaproteobacteria bacterium]|nr:LptF/LptG family permease [Gammaproteobacteria bacterium]